MKRISDFFVCEPDCPRCLGTGCVCEDHPNRAWHGGTGGEPGDNGSCECGAAGMPCKPENRGPCTHESAAGVDQAPSGPDKVWKCMACGWLHRYVPLYDPDDGITKRMVDAV